MKTVSNRRVLAGRAFLALAGFVASFSIAILTMNVSREINALSSASSDNVQWSLSQAEVEFQEFANRLQIGSDLAGLRRRFDIFYSRIDTVSNAQVFAILRDDPGFSEALTEIRQYLAETVPIIDAADAQLTEALPLLLVEARYLRPKVRQLANSGLKKFALDADRHRTEVAHTMMLLAIALAALIGALALAVVYLGRLNRQVIARSKAQKITATRMNTVIDTSLDGVIISNSEGKIIEFSPAAEAIFGHNVEDVRGRELGEIIIPDKYREAHNAGMQRMRDKGEKRVVGKGRVQLEAKRYDGSLFPVELAIQSATTDDGEIFIAFLRDITQQVADKEELIQARDRAIAGEKSRSEFLATMSHEIRTPLNGLLGNLSLLGDTPLNKKQTVYQQNMETSGRLLMSHVSDVLDITRYDSGAIDLDFKPMDISGLVSDIIDNQSGPAASRDTVLEWGWDGAPQNWVVSDRDKLQHILINLVGNAVKFTKEGKVSITMSWQNDELAIAVEDTGIGIPEDMQERIFDDFVTGNTSYDRDVGGTGLGLSITKRFVQALGGTIDLASEPGVGSTFSLSFPVIAAKPQVVATTGQAVLPVTGSAAKSAKPLRILVVEDNEINRFVVREMLVELGHSIEEAFDGKEGVEKADKAKFDLILMDISMPVLDGRSATQQIRSGDGASRNSRIVALTANALAEEREDFLKNGMDGVLTKPLSKETLHKMLAGQETENQARDLEILDRAHNAETRDVVGAENYAKLLARFYDEVDSLLTWLHSAEAQDHSEIAGQVHKVAGNAALFGAIVLRKTLLAIETAAKSGNGEDIQEGITALPELWRLSKKALETTKI